jgi:D-serine deaminase-like pyridoxal phosphate-dependent protein
MNIIKPTLLLNKERTVRNIERMAKKAESSGVRFRPHFKTHQSAEIGEWFRGVGVHAITVSSVDMAVYFQQHGWQDILIAFPVNVLEIEQINTLAETTALSLLVESVETVCFLQQHLALPLTVWIKIDSGYHRTGLLCDDVEHIVAVAKSIAQSDKLSLAGILTHSGHTYKVRSQAKVREIYAETLKGMNAVRDTLQAEGCPHIEISIGDTPSCSIIEDFSDNDEIRPGNFVFYDVMQWEVGSCSEEDIAVAIACPVVAKHPERQEIVIYGGAVHLSKETITKSFDGGKEVPMFGLIALPEAHGWGQVIEGVYVSRLSQEHGIVKTTRAFFEQVNIGDLVIVLPVHSCLAVNLLRKYCTCEGDVIETNS